MYEMLKVPNFKRHRTKTNKSPGKKSNWVVVQMS